MSYDFKGNNAALVSSINALLALDAKGALAPHGIGEMARQLLEASASRLTEQHQSQPVAWFTDDHLTDKSATTWDSEVAERWRAKGWPVSQLYTHADPVEIEALRGAYLRAGEREHELRTELAQLRAALKFYADRDHYSTDDGSNWDSCSGEPANILWHESEPWFIEDGSIARGALSASAEPSTPKCTYCGDTGQIMVGRSGDANDGNAPIMAPCEDCDGSGSSGGQMHSNGTDAPEYEPFKCETCNGFGTVPDGEVTGVGSVEFENGPVKCVKDCPDCGSGPDALTDLATWKRRAIEAESKLRTYDPQVVELGEQAMQALLAEPRPNELVLTKCRLCDQLQADMTARDQRLDQFEQVMQKLATLRGTLEQHGLREEVEALLWPGLHSRPEERGTTETEPCSGCGTPGYTGNCDKCVPY